MNEEQFRHLLSLADQREERHYAWLRNLLLTASGALTLLVTLGTAAPANAVALWSMRAAWLGLGLGTLALGVALHGEVWTADALVKKVAEELRARPGAPQPVVATRPTVYAVAERTSYALLAGSVLALACYGLAQSWHP
jgi:hypothetical protein